MSMSGCFMMQNSEDIDEDFVGRNFARARRSHNLGGGEVGPPGHLLDFSICITVSIEPSNP